MSSLYIVKAITNFAAAHVLRDYVGECARLHGHNWYVEVEVSVRSLNKIGISLDFKELKNKLRIVADIVEHQNINEIPPFDVINPTAENIAAWFYTRLKELINNNYCKLQAVTIWETDNFSIRYTEDI